MDRSLCECIGMGEKQSLGCSVPVTFYRINRHPDTKKQSLGCGVPVTFYRINSHPDTKTKFEIFYAREIMNKSLKIR